MSLQSKALGDIVEPIIEQGGPASAEFIYIDIGSIDRETKRIVDPKMLPKSKAPSRAKQRLKMGDVLVSMTRPNLNAVALVPQEHEGAIGSTGFHVLRARDALPGYVFYAVQTPDFIDAMCRKVQGALYPAVRPRDIAGYSISLPDKTKQRRIVAEIEKQFTRLEAGVAALRRVQANLKRYRAAVLKAACEGRLVPTEAELARSKPCVLGSIPAGDFDSPSPSSNPPSKRGSLSPKTREAGSTPAALHGVQKVVSSGLTSPTKRAVGSNPVDRPKEASELSPTCSTPYETGEQLLQRILADRRKNWNGRGKYVEPQAPKQTNTDALPAGWTWATFEQLSERVTVGFVGSMKHEYVESGIPFLRGQNVRENRFDPEGLLYVSRSFHETLSKSALQPGDLAVVRSGGVGVTCVIPPTLKEANCSDLVLIQRPLGFIPQYGAYYMNSLAKRHVEAGKVGVALTHFNTKSVAALAVPLPPLSEQKRIVAEAERRLSVIDELETVVTSNLARATRLRQSVLKEVFTKELNPNSCS